MCHRLFSSRCRPGLLDQQQLAISFVSATSNCMSMYICLQAKTDKLRALMASAGSLEALAESPEKLEEVTALMRQLDPGQALTFQLVGTIQAASSHATKDANLNSLTI